MRAARQAVRQTSVAAKEGTSLAGRKAPPVWLRTSYALFRPLLSLIRGIAAGWVITTEELGRAMIRAALQRAPKRVLESSDMIALGSDTN